MPIDEGKLYDLVQDMRLANLEFREEARAQIQAEYKRIKALPKRERLAAMRQKAEEVKGYLFNDWPACDDENADLAIKNLRIVLQDQFGELSDDELKSLTSRVQKAIDHDRHDDTRAIMKDAGQSPSKTHAPRTKIGL